MVTTAMIRSLSICALGFEKLLLHGLYPAPWLRRSSSTPTMHVAFRCAKGTAERTPSWDQSQRRLPCTLHKATAASPRVVSLPTRGRHTAGGQLSRAAWFFQTGLGTFVRLCRSPSSPSSPQVSQAIHNRFVPSFPRVTAGITRHRATGIACRCRPGLSTARAQSPWHPHATASR